MAPPLEPLTFEDVTKVYREEKKSSGLTAVRHDFYPAVRVLMGQMKRDYEKEAAADSYGAKARQLGQSIARMREKILQIFDMRADKVMSLAVLGAAGGKVDQSRLTDEEKRLLEVALAQVQGMRNGLLDLPRSGLEFARMSTMPMPSQAEEPQVKVEELRPVVAPVPEAPLAEPEERVPADLGPTAPSQPSPISDLPSAPMTPVEVATSLPEERRAAGGMMLLRILEDIPPFAGPSGTYRLGKEDVVTLPSGIGKGLVKRGKAVEIVPR